jgi:outer membrane protein assembly factor BamB
MAGGPDTGARVATSIAFAHRTGERPYLAIDAGALLALDPRTGAVQWRAPAPSAVSFARAAKIVVIAGGDAVRGLDPSTGQLRWTVAAPRALVAPLDGMTTLVVNSGSMSVIDAATGYRREYSGHPLTEHDRILDARSDAVIVTTDGGVARMCWLDASALREQQLGDDEARRGEPARHGVVQALLTADGAVTLDTADDLARFVR